MNQKVAFKVRGGWESAGLHGDELAWLGYGKPQLSGFDELRVTVLTETLWDMRKYPPEHDQYREGYEWCVAMDEGVVTFREACEAGGIDPDVAVVRILAEFQPPILPAPKAADIAGRDFTTWLLISGYANRAAQDIPAVAYV